MRVCLYIYVWDCVCVWNEFNWLQLETKRKNLKLGNSLKEQDQPSDNWLQKKKKKIDLYQLKYKNIIVETRDREIGDRE